MEYTSAPAWGDQTGGLSSALGQLKSSWEHGKGAAREVKRTATKSWRDVDSYVKSRPKTVALGALGAGLIVGFLTGTLASRSHRTPSRSASETG